MRFNNEKTKIIGLIVIEFLLLLGGIYALSEISMFFLTKRIASAQILEIKKVPEPKPYLISLKYFNEYSQEPILTSIKKIDGRYGQKLEGKIGEEVEIYYGKYFPKSAYLIDYKYPNIGYIILLLFFILILTLAIIFSFKTYKG